MVRAALPASSSLFALGCCSCRRGCAGCVQAGAVVMRSEVDKYVVEIFGINLKGHTY